VAVRKINDIHTFTKDELDEMRAYLPEGLDFPIFKRLYAPFGFKAVMRGKDNMWGLATEQDYRSAEAKKLGIAPEMVQINRDCASEIFPCGGLSCPGLVCRGYLNQSNNHWYCGCG
jgi:hypothetical protein